MHSYFIPLNGCFISRLCGNSTFYSFIHRLINIWIVLTLTVNNLVWTNVFSTLGSQSAESYDNCFCSLRNCQVFPKWWYHFTFPPTHRHSSFFPFLPTLTVIWLGWWLMLINFLSAYWPFIYLWENVQILCFG